MSHRKLFFYKLAAYLLSFSLFSTYIVFRTIRFIHYREKGMESSHVVWVKIYDSLWTAIS